MENCVRYQNSWVRPTVGRKTEAHPKKAHRQV
jgi:hypothetical protein